jgi:hypothetical protein
MDKTEYVAREIGQSHARRDEDMPSVRTLSILARMRTAAWLSIAGMGIQAILPLFLVFAVFSVERVDGMAGGSQSAIHHNHADHGAGPQHDPASHHQHQHQGCIICQGLQAAAPVTLPATVALMPPLRQSGLRLSVGETVLANCRSPASYLSRAPPAIA